MSRPGTSGTIDAAVLWGPIAGYYAARQRVPLELVAVPSGKGDLPFAFNISIGVRKGDDALKARVEKVRREHGAEITAILKEYGVPLMEAVRAQAK